MQGRYRVLLVPGVGLRPGLLGLHGWPCPWMIRCHIHERCPDIYAGFRYVRDALFSTPFILFHWCSTVYLCARWDRRGPSTRCPTGASPAGRPFWSWEQHYRTLPTRARRAGLSLNAPYTGVAIGAIGAGSPRPACGRHRAVFASCGGSRAQGGGADSGSERGFATGSATSLSATVRRRLRRSQSRVVVPLQPAPQRPGGTCWYGIATLMTNLFGRGRAVLAASEHELGQVRDPPASNGRRLRHALPSV